MSGPAASTASSEEKVTWGSGGLFNNRVGGAVLLILGTPVFILLFCGVCKNYDGSFVKLFEAILDEGLESILRNNFPLVPSAYAWKMVLTFILFQLVLMRIVPGKEFKATVTATGFVPTYTANGVQCYLITTITLFSLAYLKIWNPADAYDHMGECLFISNILALTLCTFLTFKGLYFPSTKECGSSGNIIFDFFWGTELYPSVFGFSIKQVTNCRYGMMLWQMLLFCYAFKQIDLFGFLSSSLFVSIFLQTVYIFKFFVWETGYFCSMDIQHDRAGYYICWGCMMWVPCVYTIHSFFLVTHPVLLSLPAAVLIAGAGLLMILWNYDIDRQRQEFRKHDGKLKIWGAEPEYIVASYVTSDGQERKSLLLCSGWWGLSRHIHYIPEILASFCWCVPALTSGILPYWYPFYLTILLVDRAWRDDLRCKEKYGQYWDKYCEKVPFKIIPGGI